MIPLKNATYDDRKTLRQNGALWDSKERYWFVPDGKDPSPFRGYMDEQTRDVYDTVAKHFETMQRQPQRNVQQQHQQQPKSDGYVSKHATQEEFLARSAYERPANFQKTHFQKLNLPDDFVVIDTETTGLGQDDEVVELSVLDSNANELYHSFFKPEKEMHWSATKVSGIEDQHLQGSPTFSSEWDKIVAAVDGRRVAGHNIGFDRRMIQQTLEKQGMDGQAICDKMFDDPIDSWRIAQQSSVGKGHRSLGSLCEAMGVEESPNHRTSYDCLGVLYVLQNFEQKDYGLGGTTRRLPDTGFSGGTQMTLELG